jgi:rhodanese-related sulfurtransferase
MSFLAALKSLFQSAPRLAPADCARRVRSGEALLVDVREPREWAQGVAAHAVLLPLSDLRGARTHWRGFLAAAGQREIYLYCASGMRSGVAARMLCADGFRAANAGGLANWTDAGWPLLPPPAART